MSLDLWESTSLIPLLLGSQSSTHTSSSYMAIVDLWCDVWLWCSVAWVKTDTLIINQIKCNYPHFVISHMVTAWNDSAILSLSAAQTCCTKYRAPWNSIRYTIKVKKSVGRQLAWNRFVLFSMLYRFLQVLHKISNQPFPPILVLKSATFDSRCTAANTLTDVAGLARLHYLLHFPWQM